MYVSQTIIMDPDDSIEPGTHESTYAVHITPGRGGSVSLLIGAPGTYVDQLTVRHDGSARAVEMIDRVIEALQIVRARALSGALLEKGAESTVAF